MWFFNPTYMIFMLPAIILMMVAQGYVNSAYRKWSKVPARIRLSGSQVAQRLLSYGGLQNIRLEGVHGNLTDHYDPAKKVLRLSEGTYNSASVVRTCPGRAHHPGGIKMAKKYDAYICAGITEREGNCLYNAVAVVGPEGHVGTYRKTHLWSEEKLWFEPGNLGFPVFSLPFGKIGCRVCYDIWFPEVTRIYVAQGADNICDSTNWVVVDPLQTKAKPTAAYSAQQMSLMNACFSICADRIGTERDCVFIGNSCITDPSGSFVSGPGSPDKPEIVMAEINLMQARYRHWSEFNNPLTDRRTDLFDTYLGYNPETRKLR